MSLTPDDVKKVAVLARLEFSDNEIAIFTEQLGNIVAFVEQLSQVPTDGVEPMAHPLDVHTVLRADELKTGLTRDDALRNSPNHDETHYLVPAVMARKV